MELAEAFVTVKLELKDLQRNLNQMRSSLDKHFDNIEKRAKESGRLAIAAFSGAVAAGASLLTKSFIGAAGSIEKMKLSLIAVTGSTQEANRQFKELIELAKMPGLGLPELVKGATSLQALNFSFAESKRIMREWGNEIVKFGGGRSELERVIVQLTQIRGKASGWGQDIRQISESMPSLRKYIALAFDNTPVEDLAKSGVTASQLIAKVTDQLAKQSRVTGGTQNAIDNFNDSLYQLKATLGDVLLPTFAKILNDLADITEKVKSLSDTTKSWIAWGTAGIGATAGIIAGLAGLAAIISKVKAGIAVLGSSLSWLVATPIGAAILAAVSLTFAIKRIADAASKPINMKIIIEKVDKERINNLKEALGMFPTQVTGFEKANLSLGDLGINLKRLNELTGLNLTNNRKLDDVLLLLNKEYQSLIGKTGAIGEVFGPPTPENINSVNEYKSNLKGIIDILSAQSRLRMANIMGMPGSDYAREQKTIQETYRATKEALEAELADAETTAERKKAIQVELQAAYKEMINDLTASYKKQGEDLIKQEKDVKDKKLKIFKEGLQEQYRFAIASFDEQSRAFQDAYTREKNERRKQREDRIADAKKQKAGIDAIWKGLTGATDKGGIPRNDKGMNTGLYQWNETFKVINQANADMDELISTTKEWGKAFTETLSTLSSSLYSVSDDFVSLWIDGLSDSENAFRSFADSIKGIFKRLMESLIRDVILSKAIRSLVQLIGVANPAAGLGLAGLFDVAQLGPAFADGGIAKGGFKIPRLAGGGIYKQPTLAMIGEGQSDEAVIPLKSGKVPVEIRGGGGLNIQNLNITLPYADLSRVGEKEVSQFIKTKLLPALNEARASGYTM